MKVSINFLSILILLVFLVSCESKKENQNENTEKSESIAVEQDLQQVKIDIKGMTCEIGCARLIQSKLYKAVRPAIHKYESQVLLYKNLK